MGILGRDVIAKDYVYMEFLSHSEKIVLGSDGNRAILRNASAR